MKAPSRPSCSSPCLCSRLRPEPAVPLGRHEDDLVSSGTTQTDSAWWRPHHEFERGSFAPLIANYQYLLCAELSENSFLFTLQRPFLWRGF